MSMFQKFQGGLAESFNVQGALGGVLKQQQMTQAAMLDVAAKFDETNKQMANLRAGVEGILGNYPTDENGKPDSSAPKYVHDAYNAVKKEGGVAGMSASQMGAVLTGYQTGVAAEQQRYNSMVVQRNIRTMQEQDQLDEAYRKTQEEREKIAKEEEKDVTTKSTQKKVYDLSSVTGIADLASDAIRGAAKSGGLMGGIVKGAQALSKKSNRKNIEDAVGTIKDIAGKIVEGQQQDDFQKRKREADTRAIYETWQKRNAELSNEAVSLIGERARLRDEYGKDIFVPGINAYGIRIGDGTSAKPSPAVIAAQSSRLNEIDARLKRIKAEQDAGANIVAPAAQARGLTGFKGKKEPINLTVESDVYETEKIKIQRTQEAMLNDEYSIMTNYLRNNGGLPSNWSKGSFMQLKGYPSIQTIPIEGVGTYVSINGKGEIIKDTPMSIGDRTNIRDAAILAQQRTLNGIDLGGNSGYIFTGEIGSNNIKDVNTVREELGKSSMALKNVDVLIKIAEDASLLDKLLPGEITGMAGGISNTIAAANRTEIGGSGAWSEADEARLQKIVRDPTSLRNMAFRQETLASLRTYKQRLTDGIQTKGQTYGFKLSGTPQDKRRAEAAIQRARISYQTAMMQGKTKEEASEIAKATYSQSLE